MLFCQPSKGEIFHELFIQNIENMNRNQLESRAYAKPEVTVCHMQTEHTLLHASGQHEDAGHGGTIGNAKQGWFDEDDEEEEEF